jgi:hypothetical protein
MLTNDPARGSVRAVTDLAGVQGGLVEANTSYLVVKGELARIAAS